MSPEPALSPRQTFFIVAHHLTAPPSPLTASSLLLFLLLAELVQWQVGHVEAVNRARQHSREGVHDAGPLRHQLLPAGERGQHCQQVVPQLPGDVYAEVGSNPRHNDGLSERWVGGGGAS